MKKWEELKSKGQKYERIQRVAVSYEIRNIIQENIDLYRKTKNEEILDEIKTRLVKQKRKFSKSNQERIDYFLSGENNNEVEIYRPFTTLTDGELQVVIRAENNVSIGDVELSLNKFNQIMRNNAKLLLTLAATGGDPFWRNSAILIINGLLDYLVENKYSSITVKNCLKILNDNSFKAYLLQQDNQAGLIEDNCYRMVIELIVSKFIISIFNIVETIVI